MECGSADGLVCSVGKAYLPLDYYSDGKSRGSQGCSSKCPLRDTIQESWRACIL